MHRLQLVITSAIVIGLGGAARAQEQNVTAIEDVAPAPPRAEGEGPFDRLILRGATLIDGTGAPPVGPVDVVVEANRIVQIKSVGYPGMAIKPENRPPANGGREIDLDGMYLLPGLIDMHWHVGGTAQGTPSEYVF